MLQSTEVATDLQVLKEYMQDFEKTGQETEHEKIVHNDRVWVLSTLEDNEADPDRTIKVYEQEVWDLKRCQKEARNRNTNAYGDSYPMPGVFQVEGAVPKRYGLQLFNGGFSEEGKWYRGWYRPLPQIHEDYEFEYCPSWGMRIKRKDED